MKSIKNKLRSNEGASITFALLLFLVCAVVSSVVLTAGTAASGRLSEIAKMDQRYYSVTSAAELLKNQFSGQTVNITETTETEITTTYNAKGEQTESTSGTPSSQKIITTIPGGKTIEIKNDGSSFSTDSLAIDAAMQYADLNMSGDGVVLTSPFTRSLNLTASGVGYTNEALEGLAVTIDETIEKNGNIELLVHNTTAAGSTDAFTLKMTFSANVHTSNDKKTVSGSPFDVTESSYKIKSTDTETRTTSASWTLTSIETVKAEAPTEAP